jgi:nicotinamide-nucleotide amidase
MLPQGCTVFDNPVGTAPGCAFSCSGVHVLMLPGPPHEMETMLRRCAVPYLRRLSREVIVSRDIMTFGMGESSVDQLLHETMSHMENPTLATYAKPCEVRLRATAKAADAAQAEAMLAPVVEQVAPPWGISSTEWMWRIWSRMPVPFEGTHWTLATAESCTGGLVAHASTALPGAPPCSAAA